MLRSLLPIGLLFFAGCVSAPPVQEMSDARQAISAAEQAGASRVATDALDDARRLLAEAEQLIQQEAYGPARLNAVRARNRAMVAARSSRGGG